MAALGFHQDEITGVVALAASFAKASATLELEAALTYKASPSEFATALATLSKLKGASPPVHSLQLDCNAGGSKRWEIYGEDRIRAFLRRGAGVGPHADRILEKRKVSEPVDIAELPIRVNLKSEKEPEASAVKSVPQSGTLSMRLKRRVSISFPKDGVRIDMTAVMSSAAGKDGEIPRLQSSRAHEVEVEAVKEQLDGVSDADVAHRLLAYIHTCYCAVKGTQDPVTKSEISSTLAAYNKLTGNAEFKFVGPSPVTLVRENLLPPTPGRISIRDDYTVTEKADGERRLLFIDGGKGYFVDNRGGVMRAYNDCPKELDGSILDGELVTKAVVTASPMRMFAVFDVFWQGGKVVAGMPLLTKGADGHRISVAKKILATLEKHAKPVDGLTAFCKNFLLVGGANWGDAVAKVYAESTRDAPYEVDGLIFTPASAPVGGYKSTDEPDLKGGPWNMALKWKPPSHNSIDFLVKTKKDRRSGVDIVRQVGPTRKKTVVLHANYNPAFFEPIVPIDYLVKGSSALPRNMMIAKPFCPTGDPVEAETELELTADGRLLCEDGDGLEDNTIVEFRWASPGWKPMRVRYDKSEKLLKTGLRGTLNAWNTALSVWDSIQHPVTLRMVCGREEVDVSAKGNSDVYYDRAISRDRTGMTDMANFHNNVVKADLYKTYGVSGGSLLELACGKGGDMPRWLDAGFSTIVGVDFSSDNIVNPDGGVYSRWESRTKLLKNKPVAAFITMDASVRMFPPLDELGEASAKAGQSELVSTMWGQEPAVRPELANLNGVMTKGFHLVSCQFSIHYLFQDGDMLDRFVANVSRMTKVGGHFICTVFDGDKIAAGLVAGDMVGRVGGTVLWNITKQYEGDFKGETGKAIGVYIVTIGQVITEYLVSSRTLQARMEKAGFKLVASEMFEEVHKRLKGEPLSPVEAAYSFLNRTFVFKKAK
jgi:hypothetical protein